MYTIYIPKREREKAEHEITKVIHTYLQLRPNTSGVICFPGYMTRDELIEDYWRNLFGNIVKGDFYISFSKGMTGETRRKLNKEIIETGLVNNLKYFDIDIPTPKDHSKVMLFYKSKCDSDRLDSRSPKNDLSEFIEKNTIEAMLIGSSNQSHSTYFGEYASYGETDIMMIACNHLDDTNCRTPKEIFLTMSGIKILHMTLQFTV